jgi:hypothetical protein
MTIKLPFYHNDLGYDPIHRYDPVVYLREPSVALEIFKYLFKPSEWNACCLVSRSWQSLNKKLHSLIRAIENNQLDRIIALLAQGAPVRVKIDGTKLISITEDTPYLRAKDYNHEKIASVLKEKDGDFSETMIRNKLDCLRFEIACSFSVEGEAFQGEGLSHVIHHEYLLPDMIRSLRSYFEQLQDTESWDRKKSARVLATLEKYPKSCLSCLTEDELKETSDSIDRNELLILSDSSIAKHRHWITFAIKKPYYGIGNRGYGCGEYSGAPIYKKDDDFKLNHLSALFDTTTAPDFYIRLPEQKTGSCSRTSVEAAILTSMFLLLRDAYEDEPTPQQISELKGIASCLFLGWRNYDQKSCLDRIMNDPSIEYDQDLLVRYLAVFSGCLETAQKFYCFLLSRGSIRWGHIDSKGMSPYDCVIKNRNIIFFNQLLSGVIAQTSSGIISQAKAKSDSETSCEFWNQIEKLNNAQQLHGFDYQDSIIRTYSIVDAMNVYSTDIKKCLMTISYDPSTFNCSIDLTLDSVHSLHNVQSCLLLLRSSHAIKFKTSRPDISIIIHIDLNSPSQLEEVINKVKESLIDSAYIRKQLNDSVTLYNTFKSLEEINDEDSHLYMNPILIIFDVLSSIPLATRPDLRNCFEQFQNSKSENVRYFCTSAINRISPILKADPNNNPINYGVSIDYDVGYGNALYIRGDGPGMSWNKGKPMTWIDGKWVFDFGSKFEDFGYKVLINDNDRQWEVGDNHRSKDGQFETIHIKF